MGVMDPVKGFGVTFAHLFDRLTITLSRAYQRILAWSLVHKLATLAIAASTLVASFFLVPVLGAEFVPKADFSETLVNFYTPVGSSLELTEQRAKQIDAALRELPEVRYTVTTIWSTARTEPAASTR